MTILFIAPLPPPVNGQSLASAVLLRQLEISNDVVVVDLAKKRPVNRLAKLGRFLTVAGFFGQIWRARTHADLIYLTVSESVLGNLKDMVAYLLCFGSLDKLVIHMHGGANMTRLMSSEYPMLLRLNRFFLGRIKAAIVLGQSHTKIYRGSMPEERIRIVPNSAEDYLFVEPDHLSGKFGRGGPIEVLFLSNLLDGKGYKELLDGFVALDESFRIQMVLHFAGAFPSEDAEVRFMQKARQHENVRYHGVVGGAAKKALFDRAHVFCLPTYYAFEGQPISILEAYASGCVVVTTDHSGIRDIFTPEVNGFEVVKGVSESIRGVLQHIVQNRGSLHAIATHNRAEADERYRASKYCSSVESILLENTTATTVS